MAKPYLHYPLLLVLISQLTFSALAAAEVIEKSLHKDIKVTANYHAGNPDQPALLILHGFLQTANSEPMHSLANNLASKGYTTLSPTISLRINKRKQTTPCEAVHTHLVDEDVNEIAFWYNWLIKQGHKKIELIGFSSTGNFEALVFAARHQTPATKRIILTSLNPVAVDQTEFKSNTRPNQKLLNEQKIPGIYTLGYCKKNFAATPATYHSYAQYDEHKLLELIKQSTIPLSIILGTNDTVLPLHWPKRIRDLQTGAEVKIIPNANHFFDGTAEFDLAEAIESILKSMQAQ